MKASPGRAGQLVGASAPACAWPLHQCKLAPGPPSAAKEQHRACLRAKALSGLPRCRRVARGRLPERSPLTFSRCLRALTTSAPLLCRLEGSCLGAPLSTSAWHRRAAWGGGGCARCAKCSSATRAHLLRSSSRSTSKMPSTPSTERSHFDRFVSTWPPLLSGATAHTPACSAGFGPLRRGSSKETFTGRSSLPWRRRLSWTMYCWLGTPPCCGGVAAAYCHCATGRPAPQPELIACTGGCSHGLPCAHTLQHDGHRLAAWAPVRCVL